MDTPIHEIMEDNNTEFNNTFNNTSDNSLLLQDTLTNMSNRDEKSQKVVADNIYKFLSTKFWSLKSIDWREARRMGERFRRRVSQRSLN